MNKPEGKELNQEVDVTKFINIDDKEFVIRINGKIVKTLQAGEEATFPVFVAKTASKHLVDRILQEKGVADSNRPSPERDAIFAKIIPDVAEEVIEKPLSEEEFREKINKRIEDQEKLTSELGGKASEKDTKIDRLEKEIAKLKQVKITK